MLSSRKSAQPLEVQVPLTIIGEVVGEAGGISSMQEIRDSEFPYLGVIENIAAPVKFSVI